jgi:hypothetical protein
MSAKATGWNYGTVDLAVGYGPVSDLASMLDPQEGKEVQELEDWIASKVLGRGKPAQTANSMGTANPQASAVPEGGHQR